MAKNGATAQSIAVILCFLPLRHDPKREAKIRAIEKAGTEAIEFTTDGLKVLFQRMQKNGLDADGLRLVAETEREPSFTHSKRMTVSPQVFQLILDFWRAQPHDST